MTMQELVNMVGSNEQADYAMEIILKSLKPNFVKSVVQAEIESIGRQIQSMKDEGFIVTTNGHDSVNWGKAESLNGWNLSEEQQAAYDDARKKCEHCCDLLYKRNRTVNLVSIK